MRLGALALLVLLVACPNTPPTPNPAIPLSLQFVLRQSCGRITAADYDTQCLAAVYVAVYDEAHVPIYDECEVIDDPPDTMGALLEGRPILSFSKLSANKTVSFEVRGLHALDLDPADRASVCNDQNRDHWLFWGTSELVDLAALDTPDAGRALVPLVVDCRDCSESCAAGECFGCLAMDTDGSGTCHATPFPASVCSPTAVCGRSCDDDDDCFDGALECVDDRCDVDSAPTGALCAPCTAGAGDCADEHLCVGTSSSDANGFCAPVCPDNLCATGTKCTRLGNGIVELQPPDAGP